MTDCLKTIQSGLPKESSKGKYLDKYWDNIPHYMLFDAVMEYILYIKPDAIEDVEVEYSRPTNAKVLLPCANRFKEMLESFITDVIIENRTTRPKESDTIKGKLETVGVSQSAVALPRMIPVIKNLLVYIKSKGETDEKVMFKQIKLGLLLEQDYDESDNATFALFTNYNTGEEGGIIPLNIRNRKDHYKKTQNYQNIANSKYYVGFRPNYKEGKTNHLMNVFFPDSFLDKYYKLNSKRLINSALLTKQIDIHNYGPYGYVLNVIYLMLNYETNKDILTDNNKQYIFDQVKSEIENFLNITDFENCFIGHYMPKGDTENIYSYNDDLLIEIENEYVKMELEIVEAIKIKYFTHFCDGIIQSRAQITSKTATRDMRLALMLKWYRIYFNNILIPDSISELFDLSYYISENEVFSLMSQLVNEGQISPFGDFKKNSDAPKSSFFNKIQKIKAFEIEKLDELKKLIIFLKENKNNLSIIIEKLRGLSDNLIRDLLIYLVNYDTKKFVFDLLKKLGKKKKIADVSNIDSDYYYIELQASKTYTLQDLEKDIRFLVKETEAKRADIFLENGGVTPPRSRIPSLGANLYKGKNGTASITQNHDLYDILTTNINYSMIKTLLVLGYKFLESSFSSTEKSQGKDLIDSLDKTFYNKIISAIGLGKNKYIKLDTTNTKGISFEDLELNVLINAIFDDERVISFAQKIKNNKDFPIFLQDHRFILERTGLEIRKNNTDIPVVDTILERIRSTVYAFPNKHGPPLPKRSLPATEEAEVPPNLQFQLREYPPPLHPTGPEHFLHFELLNTIKQTLLYLYLSPSDTFSFNSDKYHETVRDYNEKINDRAERLKVINDFLQDVNGHIEDDNLIIAGNRYTREDILGENYLLFYKEILAKKQLREEREEQRRRDEELGPMMERYQKMIEAESSEVTEKSLVTRFSFNVRNKIDEVQSDNPEDIYEGVFIPISQYSTQCGLHAINNLLQINELNCLVNPTKCARGSDGRSGEMMMATDIIQTINETDLNPPFYAVEWTDYIKVEDINSNIEISQKFRDDLPDTFKNADGNAKQLVGLIERVGRDHWVAWLHKGENWYKIDSKGEAETDENGLVKFMRGTLTKYPNTLANEILVNRPKHDLLAIPQLGIKYEHILVFSNQIPGECNFINRAAATATGGALKTRHSKKVFREGRKNIKSKKRLF